MARMNCYLTAFNQLTWLRQMVEHVARLDMEPVILDMASTYPPLLEWYKTKPCRIDFAGRNYGCYGFWSSQRHRLEKDYYAVSDSDLDLSAVPKDATNRMVEAFNKHHWAVKAGLSLEINDLPDHFSMKEFIRGVEAKYWTDRLDDGNWRAGVGATLAVYNQKKRPVNAYTLEFYNPAVRLDRPYTARHMPWYLDDSKLTDEQEYMLKTYQSPATQFPMMRRAREEKAARVDSR